MADTGYEKLAQENRQLLTSMQELFASHVGASNVVRWTPANEAMGLWVLQITYRGRDVYILHKMHDEPGNPRDFQVIEVAHGDGFPFRHMAGSHHNAFGAIHQAAHLMGLLVTRPD